MSSPGWRSIALALPLAGAWLLLLAITALAWAWRATDPAWLLPATLALQVLLGLVATVTARHWLATGTARRAAQGLLGVVGLGALLGMLSPGHPTAAPGPGKTVAVVGAGAAGMHAAWMLDRAGADVTVYEAAGYVGGHAYAHPFEHPGGTHPIDLGFMFGSPTAYKEFKALLALHGIERNQTSLAMASDIDGTWWATGMDGLDPEVLRFQALAERDHDNPALNLVPFKAWLWWHGFDAGFRRTYVTSLMSVLMITDTGLFEVSTRFALKMLAGPQRWLDYEGASPAWVVRGGSTSYYEALSDDLAGRIRLWSPVTAVSREGGRVRITASGPTGRTEEVYDAVVMGVHADVARRLLSDATWFEDLVLSQVRYDSSEMAVHTDRSPFPDGELLRSYAYVDRGGERFELHSLPVRSQADAIALDPEPVVTLNPSRVYDGERVRRTWRHHTQDIWHLAFMLEAMPRLQGRGNVWYAGDWVRFIGHGQAIVTAVDAACRIAGTDTPATLPTEPCLDVTLVDATVDSERQVARFCGERDVHAYLVDRVCSGRGMLP